MRNGDPAKRRAGATRTESKQSRPFELIRVKNGEIKRLDLADSSIRAKVFSVYSNQALDLIFAG